MRPGFSSLYRFHTPHDHRSIRKLLITFAIWPYMKYFIDYLLLALCLKYAEVQDGSSTFSRCNIPDEVPLTIDDSLIIPNQHVSKKRSKGGTGKDRVRCKENERHDMSMTAPFKKVVARVSYPLCMDMMPTTVAP